MKTNSQPDDYLQNLRLFGTCESPPDCSRCSLQSHPESFKVVQSPSKSSRVLTALRLTTEHIVRQHENQITEAREARSGQLALI